MSTGLGSKPEIVPSCGTGMFDKHKLIPPHKGTWEDKKSNSSHMVNVLGFVAVMNQQEKKTVRLGEVK